ncbi:hypothetical protein Hanom_Chr09g00833611 [Helianthus anomalus]
MLPRLLLVTKKYARCGASRLPRPLPCDQEIREMRCKPHRRPRRLFACIPCRDENAHMMRC